jgi:hypothetical protein
VSIVDLDNSVYKLERLGLAGAPTAHPPLASTETPRSVLVGGASLFLNCNPLARSPASLSLSRIFVCFHGAPLLLHPFLAPSLVTSAKIHLSPQELLRLYMQATPAAGCEFSPAVLLLPSSSFLIRHCWLH